LPIDTQKTRVNCYTCMRPVSTCVCDQINPIQTKTRFIILMHPKEYKKERNGTGHMTKLQLVNSEIIVGVDFTENKRVNELLSAKNSPSYLMYPGVDSFNFSVKSSSDITSFMGDAPNIFILDGTWPCARKMLKMSKNLQGLNRVSFDNQIKSKFSFKQQPEPLCLSTIESVYTVLNLLKKGSFENCETEGFLKPFEKMIEYQVHYILNPPASGYRTHRAREILPMDRYKKKTQRSVFYNQ